MYLRRWRPLLLMACCAVLGADVIRCRADNVLELREVRTDGKTGKRLPLPADAMRVFTYEGRPLSMHLTRHAILLEYAHSGVILDRNGKLKRLTVVDGWPAARPALFPPRPARPSYPLVGPGVVDYWTEQKAPAVVASIKYDGRTWNALQPATFLKNLLIRGDYATRRKQFGAWTPILRKLNEECALEMTGLPGRPTERYTVKEGLTSNIVTHLAVADGSLWAACVDIYDPARDQWDVGGLCRFDARRKRWRYVSIEGRPVRWVTLLQVVGDELWVGYREGRGVAGDRVAYGKGVYPDHYRPQVSAVVLARLKGGKWTRFARPPRLDEPGRPRTGRDVTRDPSTEVPRRLAKVGNQVLLFSTTATNHASGNWNVPLAGGLSLLELDGPRWRLFDAAKDLDADELMDLVADDGAVLVSSNRGVHFWEADRKAWKKLDTGAALVNSAISSVAAVGEELWVGYTNQSFGVTGDQGISRHDERTGKWSYLPPRQLGTASPVKSVRVAPAGDVWVLFAPRPWGGAAMEYPFYAREARRPSPRGLGRWHKGKWQFPVKLDGVPDVNEVEVTAPDGKVTKRKRPLPVTELVLAGESVFVANETGLYQGPGQWRRLLEGRLMALRPLKGGKGLEVVRRVPKGMNEPDGYQRGVYRFATKKWAFTDVDFNGAWRMVYQETGEDSVAGWAPIRTGQGTWQVGPLGGERLRVVETPRAYWMVSHGQLVRLDRARLAALLEKR
jgi:hypothetical protein